MDLNDERLNPAWDVFARIRMDLIQVGEDERILKQWEEMLCYMAPEE